MKEIQAFKLEQNHFRGLNKILLEVLQIALARGQAAGSPKRKFKCKVISHPKRALRERKPSRGGRHNRSGTLKL